MRPTLPSELVAEYERRFGDRLVALVLYGSRSRGDGNDDSDVDLMLFVDELPADPFERAALVRAPLFNPHDPPVSVRAMTREEYERDIAPLDLDIAVDGVILFDSERPGLGAHGTGYLHSRLELIRQRIAEAGLYRDRALTWRFCVEPTRRDWQVSWGQVVI